MKVFLLSLFVAVAFAAPAPLDEETGEPVELIVNGVPEGEALEIGDVLGIKVKEHVDGAIVSATDLLHPLTAAGIAEAEIAERPEEPVPQPPAIPEDIPFPEPEIIPAPVEIPEPVIPDLIPEPIVVPDPILPELIPPVENYPVPQPPSESYPEVNLPVENYPEVNPPVDNYPELNPPAQPEPDAQFPNGEIFNNGVVQVSLNAESGVMSTVQSWFSMVLNYFNGVYVSSQQIV